MDTTLLLQQLNELLHQADPSLGADVSFELLVKNNEKSPLDSLGQFEFAQLIEESFEIHISHEELATLRKPSEALSLLQEKIR